MSTRRFFEDPWILRVRVVAVWMIICGGLISCGGENMKDRERQQSAKEERKEPNKIMMI